VVSDGQMKEIGLEVNAEKTKYMVILRNQSARQNQNIKIDNKLFERVEQFKYLGDVFAFNRHTVFGNVPYKRTHRTETTAQSRSCKKTQTALQSSLSKFMLL
jgi:hypothetical protein